MNWTKALHAHNHKGFFRIDDKDQYLFMHPIGMEKKERIHKIFIVGHGYCTFKNNAVRIGSEWRIDWVMVIPRGDGYYEAVP